MLRTAAFLLLACWVASDSGFASAQPGTPDKCGYIAIVTAIRGGQTPDVSGCDFIPVYRNLQEAGLRPTRDEVADAAVERGQVSRIAVQDNSAIIYVSTGAPPKPSFTISAPQKVQEGDKLTLTVRRDGNDNQAHRLEFITDRTELLTEVIPPLVFEPAADEQSFTVATAWGQPGDGVHELRIAIAADESGEGGEPISVTITDAPPNAYAIEPLATVRRGDAIEFRISRSGPLRPDSLEFDFVQDGAVIQPAGMQHPLNFDEGNDTISLTLPVGSYSPCRMPPTLTLRLETPVSGSASFVDQPPSYCAEPPPPTFPPPWWPIPVAIITLIGIVYTVSKYWPPITPPVLYPTWDIEVGVPAAAADLPQIPGWPRFSIRTTLEWGGASLPDPLPLAEKKDG
jgi:hypothetical protein